MSRARRCEPPAPGQDLGLPDARVLGADAEVARKRELAPAAERVAPHGRDYRTRDRGYRVERGAEGVDRRASAGLVGELADIGTRRERLLAARDHNRLDAPIGGERLRRVTQVAEQRDRQRVHRRTVEAEQRDATVVTFGEHEFGHGGRS